MSKWVFRFSSRLVNFTFRLSTRIAILIGLLVLVSCSEGGARTDSGGNPVLVASLEADDLGLTEQLQVLQDGRVTKDEYELAVSATINCYRAQGHNIADPVLSPVNGLILLFNKPAQSSNVSSAPVDCSDIYLRLVERSYRETHENRMNKELRDRVSECLRDRGLRPSGDEDSADDYYAEFGERNFGDMIECIGEEASKLFPHLQVIPIP